MRSIFDQYSQEENRVTHALLCSLGKDPRLLAAFVQWITGGKAPGNYLGITEQGFPGEPVEPSEEEAERRGLPDGCIDNGSGWALLVESKVAAKIKADQLRRHLKTAERHGLHDCRLLILFAENTAPATIPGAILKRWSEIYVWLKHQAQAHNSDWANWCAEYFEVAEMKFSEHGYLKQGTLTVFTGIPFTEENPYTYLQAKRLLGLLREELVKDVRLAQKLNANLGGSGRSAITGRGADRVWDYISMRNAFGVSVFTKYPHLTFSIHKDQATACVTVPNNVKRAVRSQLLGVDEDAFKDRIEAITTKMALSLAKTEGAVPFVALVQRHYRSQRSAPSIDALMEFDLRTAFSTKKASRVKKQPEWLAACWAILSNRRSNIQLQIGAHFPYEDCPVTKQPYLAKAIADVWLSCKSITDLAK